MKEITAYINQIPIKRNFVENLPYNSKLKSRARALRKAGNYSEVVFWQQVHKNKFHSIDFDRQRIIGNYIVDFYVKTLGVIIEIDGSSHNDKEEYDQKREDYFLSLGLKVYRISDLRVTLVQFVKASTASCRRSMQSSACDSSAPSMMSCESVATCCDGTGTSWSRRRVLLLCETLRTRRSVLPRCWLIELKIAMGYLPTSETPELRLGCTTGRPCTATPRSPALRGLASSMLPIQ